MKPHGRNLLVPALVAWLSACGGGGDGAVTSGTPTTTGRFVDAPTQGVSYTCGTSSGTTDANGNFNFTAGDTCTFKVGDITLGSAVGKPLVSPVDLVAGATSETNPVVTNITQFLMSMDSDNDPSNGIVITTASQGALAGRSLDFTLPATAFAAAAQPIVAAAISGRALVTTSAAQSHLGATLLGLFAGSYNCLYAGTDGGSVSAVIANGTVSGSGRSAINSTTTFTVNGAIASNGSADLNVTSGGSSTGARWSGSFTTSGSGSGNWANGPTAGGTWTCSKA